MNCPKCNTPILTASPFCTSCGAVTGDPGAQTVAISLLELEDPLLKALRQELALEYYVEREIGRGGMAIVFKAKEVGLERQVALKVLPPEMAMAGGTADRFKREARLAAAMDHQNIIPIYRVGQAGNFHYMAMKYVEGRAVDAMSHNQGALPIPVVTRILRDAASALAFAHDAGIIHRDVKGGNILVDKGDGRVLMSDFGIARAAGEASLTASGMMVGTPSFMSPEQCGAGAVGPQSDQYSLGILGFQLLTGQLPFEAESLVEIIQHHYMTPPPDLREVRKEVPDELYQVIYKALEKNPNDRYGTTTEMAEALDAVPISPEERKDAVAMLKELATGQKIDEIRTKSLPPSKLRTGGLAKVGSGTSITSAPTKSRTGLIVGGVIALVGLAAVGAYVVVNGGRNGNPAQPGNEQPAPETRPGLVQFNGLPPGAKTFIDGKEVSRNEQIPAGVHTYLLTAPGFRPDSGPVNVAPGESRTLVVHMTPVGGATPRPLTPGDRPPAGAVTPPRPALGTTRFSVGTDPTTAEVFLDDARIGAGRVIGQEVSAGQHRVRIIQSGCQTFDSTFTAQANEPITFGRISLKGCGGGP